jgi:TIR domain
LSQPITLFISHRWAEGEHALAMELAEKLATYLDLKVIIDEGGLKAGVNIEKWMRTSVRLADIFLYLMTPFSLESPNCQLELSVAQKNRKPIIPILVRNATLPNALSKLKYVDLRSAKTLPFAKMEEIVDAIRYHVEAREEAGRDKKVAEKTKGIGSQSLTALSMTENVQIGAWIMPITQPTPQFLVASSTLYVSMTNIATIPRDVIVDARIRERASNSDPFQTWRWQKGLSSGSIFRGARL